MRLRLHRKHLPTHYRYEVATRRYRSRLANTIRLYPLVTIKAKGGLERECIVYEHLTTTNDARPGRRLAGTRTDNPPKCDRLYNGTFPDNRLEQT
ncbi:hypothetical protein EVAR_45410_1 [Eumeta japonica]|uniref:Uncharacterized protein n=1 Tax=Eumeta variegata TaxID=151549 RepID=A0A4C1WTS8_EUMVA|nr:hypothetical protein EVAR_45410_1 [Eumeta japonica]